MPSHTTIACAYEHCGHEFEAEPEGGHRLLCGSSTETDAVDRLMNGERAVLVATDPPYLVDYAVPRMAGNGALRPSTVSTRAPRRIAVLSG
jgi:hypothetical protein